MPAAVPLTKACGRTSFTVGAYYTDTDMDATQRAFYTTPAGREVGKGMATVYIQKAF